jgi:hypothetical protein
MSRGKDVIGVIRMAHYSEFTVESDGRVYYPNGDECVHATLEGDALVLLGQYTFDPNPTSMSYLFLCKLKQILQDNAFEEEVLSGREGRSV